MFNWESSQLIVAKSSLSNARGATASLLWLMTALRMKSEMLLEPVEAVT